MTNAGTPHLEGALGAEPAARSARVGRHESHLTPRTVRGRDGGHIVLATLQRSLERGDVDLRLRARVTDLLPVRRVIVPRPGRAA